jgi:5-carboxyvanillate decarboxylase
MSSGRTSRRRLIAIEEAFACPEWMEAVRSITKTVWWDMDAETLGMLLEDPSARGVHDALLDVDSGRIGMMDEAGIDVSILSLVSPGVQLFDADTATAIAQVANDRLAEAIARHPRRLAGLASFAPQDPQRAAKEIERAIVKLKLNGLIVNSHTSGEYLDAPKFAPILEAASALGTPLYLHPRNPPGELRRFLKTATGIALSTSMWGFQMETSLHALRLILDGVFDRFPKLKVVLGHLGEGLPFWLYRLDYSQPNGTNCKRAPSEYFRENIWIATSGLGDHPSCQPALTYCHSVLGAERIMFAVDHPFCDMKEAVAIIDNVPLPAPDLDRIAHANAEGLFGIPPRS